LLKEKLDDVLTSISQRERKILEMRFGLVDGYGYTLEEIGKIYNVTRERIRQIEAKALRKLRHPTRIHHLQGFLESKEEAFSHGVLTRSVQNFNHDGVSATDSLQIQAAFYPSVCGRSSSFAIRYSLVRLAPCSSVFNTFYPDSEGPRHTDREYRVC